METLSAYNLPPGFGFHPTDVELVSHYLKKKLSGVKIEYEVIPEVDIYKHEPWDLPAKCNFPTTDSKWHFFNARDRKYPNSNGARSNRATEAGYWKSTGKDRDIKFKNRVIGSKKTLVFHEGRPPHGKRSDWIMHEYYMDEKELKAFPNMKNMFVLCRITKRNGFAPEEETSIQISEVDNCSSQTVDANMSGLKDESPSSCENDFEAWFAELYDPKAAPTMNDILIESKELPSHAPKQEPVGSFLPSFSDELDFLLSRDDQQRPVEPHNSVSKICGTVDSEPIAVSPDQEEDELDDFLSSLLVHEHPQNTTVYELSGTFGNSVSNHCTNFADELDKREEPTSTGPNVVETGIHIRQRRGKPSQGVISTRIKLQVSKLQKDNREVSATCKVYNRDLNHNLGYCEEYVSHTGTEDNIDTLPISELDSLSILEGTSSFSAYENGESSNCVPGILGGISGICMLLIRCSSSGLNRLVLMATIMVLVLYFFLWNLVGLRSSSQ